MRLDVGGFMIALCASTSALRARAGGIRRAAAAGAPASSAPPRGPTMDEIVALCKARGFVFASSEIYNGFNGFYDYGPLGTELKRNIKDRWWRDFVHARDDVTGVDTSIIANPKVWAASGHVDGFSDPMVDDRDTKRRYRADQLWYGDAFDAASGAVLGRVCVAESDDVERDAAELAARHFRTVPGFSGTVRRPLSLANVASAPPDAADAMPPPGDPGRPGALTRPRAFNLMFETRVGAAADDAASAYLRPETAQGIFVNFKNVAGTRRAA